MTELTPNSLDGDDDIKTPRDLFRRWQLELKISSKREEAWRKNASKIWKRYRTEERKKNSFNILWANTDILKSALYSSLPKPDVRRRFKDADPVGKAVSEVISRSLEFATDGYGFDKQIRAAVLDALLPGRGIIRVRYVPSFTQVGDVGQTGIEDNENETHEAEEGITEELSWEQVAIEHVQWDDFRMGAGKTWDEVQWIAYRHRLTRDEIIDLAGEEVGRKVNLTNPADESVNNLRDDDPLQDIFKTGEVWEIWDKENRQVIFITEGYQAGPLKIVDDPLQFDKFYDTPCPLYALDDNETTVPTPLYEQYREQAEELDRISTRINKITDSLKVRGVYDSTMSELSELFRGNDNDLIPVKNATAMIERGGIEKAIWFAPIEMASAVIERLYVQREQCQGVIFQILGLADIMRGQSNANETATAQGIKSQWGSLRLKNLQGEVQRYIRDLMRMMAEVVSSRFMPETIVQMTQLNLPTEAQVQQQMMQMQAQQQGQPFNPPPPPVTWEQVFQVLKSDAMRTYKIDIETDSTISATLEQDTQGMNELLTGLVQFFNGMAPLVQGGFMPVDAVKEIALGICRRSKMGNAVEDSLDKIQQPPPPPDPMQAEQAKAQQQAQLEQFKASLKAESDQKKAEMDAQVKMAVESANLQSQERMQTIQMEMDAKLAMLQSHLDMMKESMKNQTELKKAEMQPMVQ